MMNLQTNNKIAIMVIILLAGCLGQMASDIYSPALGQISKELHTTINYTQISMATYMIGMAVSMLFYGIWSEGIGRRKPMLTGLAITTFGVLLSYFSVNITMLIIARLITGLGAGATTCLWRSILRDCYSGDEMAKYGSYLALGIIFLIPTAPAIGGLMTQYFGWRSIFMLLTIYTILIFLIVRFILPETNASQHPDRLKMSFIIPAVKEVISHREFIGTVLVVFLCYGAFFSWFSAGAALLVHHMHMSPAMFGAVNFIAAAVTTSIASVVNGRLVLRLGSYKMLRLAWILMFTSGAAMVAFNLFGHTTIPYVFGAATLFYFGVSFIWPNCTAIALKSFGHIAGIAGSLYGFTQIIGGGVLGLLVAYLPDYTPVPLGVIFMSAPILGWVLFKWIVEQN